VVVEHIYYENHKKKHIQSQYAHLSRIDVKAGEIVSRRQLVGAIGRDPEDNYLAHLHLEVRSNTRLHAAYWPSSNGRDLKWIRSNYLAPTPFIKGHRHLVVPQDEDNLIVVEHEYYRMHHYQRGVLKGSYEVAFGQSKGVKKRRGDNRTPKGMYFVVVKHKGSFKGPYRQYFGGHWIKVNYPNTFDADRGTRMGLIGKTIAKKIKKRWAKRLLTPQKTKLGGGIGFHGWEGPWRLADGGHLSWGCIVMHNPDIAKVFDHIPKGTVVVIR
jgi:hypothetical protein